MRVVDDYPPNYPLVAAAFDLRDGRTRTGMRVLFAYGDTIYAPGSNGVVSAPLIAHETAHGLRQGDDPVGWWRQYIGDRDFRLKEEIIGHRAEYRWHVDNDPNRASRRRWSAIIAAKLAAPLYGGLISRRAARAVLQEDDR